MKLFKTIAIAIVLFATTAFIVTPTTVYICNSQYATKYHYASDCRGLNACKSEIIGVSLSSAKETRTLCGWED